MTVRDLLIKRRKDIDSTYIELLKKEKAVLYTVLMRDGEPEVLGIFDNYEEAEQVALDTKRECLIQVHDFIGSKVRGDWLKEVNRQ